MYYDSLLHYISDFQSSSHRTLGVYINIQGVHVNEQNGIHEIKESTVVNYNTTL